MLIVVPWATGKRLDYPITHPNWGMQLFFFFSEASRLKSSIPLTQKHNLKKNTLNRMDNVMA